MSRIGKKPIAIPDGVTVVKEDGSVSIRGPKGAIVLSFPREVEISIEPGEVHVRPNWSAAKEGKVRAQWGTARALLANAIAGVTKGFEKKLEIEGVGYRVQAEGSSTIVLYVGFSHPVRLQVPEGIALTIDKNIITISGVDRQGVGQFAAQIRSVKKVEPYKGKGIRYVGEHVVRKEGKKVVATTK